MALFRNHYACPRCNYAWADEWSATCDDDCPLCGMRHISPHESEDVEDPYTLSNDIHPWRPTQKSYNDFERVAVTLLPPPAPPIHYPHVPDVLAEPYSPKQMELFK